MNFPDYIQKYLRNIRRSKSLRSLLNISFLLSILGAYPLLSLLPFKYLEIFGLVIPKNMLFLLICSIIILVFFVLEILIWRKQKRNNPLFPQVEFSASQNDILGAKNALIDGEGANPYFVHVAARLMETEKVIDHLSQISNIAFIGGESGTGKSTLALQTAHLLQEREKRKVYMVKTDFLYEYIDSKKEDLQDALELISDEPSILICDDIHRLDLLYKNKFKGILKKCILKNKNLKVIWIETNFDLENELDEDFLQIDIRDSLDKVLTVLESFKKDENMSLKLNGLEDAKTMASRNKIKDVWQLSLISSKAEQQLRNFFQSFADFDALTMLYLVSLNTVLTGEKDQDQTFFFQKFSELARLPEFSWFNPQDAKRVLKKLNQPQKSFRRLIHMTPSGGGGVMVSSLHYKFSRMILRLLHEFPQFEEKYLIILKTLLHDPRISKDIKYLHVWLNDNPAVQEDFFNTEQNWIIDYINNLDPNHLANYTQILKIINHNGSSKDIVAQLDSEKILESLENVPLEQLSVLNQFLNALSEEKQGVLLRKLNKVKIFEKMNSITLENFQKINHLLNYANNQKVFDFHEAIKIDLLAERVADVSLWQLPNLYQLSLSLKKKGPEFLELINYKPLIKKINTSNSFNFHHLSELLMVLPYKKLEEVLDLLDYQHLADKANNTTLVELQHLEGFLDTLHYRKEGFILSLNMERLAQTANQAQDKNLDSVARFIGALAPLSGHFTHMLNLSHFSALVHQADFNRYRAVHSFSKSLGNREKEFLDQLDLKILADKVNTAKLKNFFDVSFLISLLGDRRNELIEQLDLNYLNSQVQGITIYEMNYLRNLMRSLHNRAPEMRSLLNHTEIAGLMNKADLKASSKIYDASALYGTDRYLLLDQLDIRTIIDKIHSGGFKKLNYSEQIFDAMHDRRELITENLNLNLFTNEINRIKGKKNLRDGVFYLPRLLRMADFRLNEIFNSLEKKIIEIIGYAYPENAIEIAGIIDNHYPNWSHRVDWTYQLTKFELNAFQLRKILSVMEKIQHMTVQKEYAAQKIIEHKEQFQSALIELINDFREKDRFIILTQFSQLLVRINSSLPAVLFDESVKNHLKKMKFTAEEYGALRGLFEIEGMKPIFNQVLLSASFQENINQTKSTEYFKYFTEEYEVLTKTLKSLHSFPVK